MLLLNISGKIKVRMHYPELRALVITKGLGWIFRCSLAYIGKVQFKMEPGPLPNH
jgi:hypothetical protein